MAGEYQFSLIDVTKQVGAKTILKDVNLSFFYGAHIGVIGSNGAGKSSLLKILACECLICCGGDIVALHETLCKVLAALHLCGCL